MKAKIAAAIAETKTWQTRGWTMTFGGSELNSLAAARAARADRAAGSVEAIIYWEEVLGSSQYAVILGRQASAALVKGDLTAAIAAAREAAQEEKKWGDDPTWGPIVALLEEGV